MTKPDSFGSVSANSGPFPAALRNGLARTGAAGAGVLLAVSGGADSMAMLTGLKGIAAESGISRIAVAHLNHGLRGRESDLDASLVERICAAAGIDCIIETIRPQELKSRARGSLEESARAARYEFLLRTATARQLPFVATAHHQQDLTETVLFSLLRGTGLRGLRGIPPVRSLSERVQLIRPLLHIDRDVILDFVQNEKIEFREDSSNLSGEFARNRIRMLMSSVPAESARRLEGQLLALSSQAAATADAIDTVAGQILESSLLETSASMARLERARLLEWPEPLVRHALILLWSRQHWPRQKMNAAHWQRLSKAALTGTPRRWSFPGGVQLSLTRTLLRLERLTEDND